LEGGISIDPSKIKDLLS
jgi:hypothetical protein